jgi:hypothetical protein
MAVYTFIISGLDKSSTNDYEHALVIDIKGASTQPKATLDVFPRKPNCTDNQLWENDQSSVQTSGGGWYYFLKSKSNGLVITANGNSLEMAAQKSPDSDDQLFDFNPAGPPDGFGVQWYTILNKQSTNAISVKGSAMKAGTPIELDSPTGNPNQQWFQQS